MRRIVFVSLLGVLSVSAVFARQSQTPPPSPTPQSTPPATATVTTGRSGMVVVDRQTMGTRSGGGPERVTITNLLAPAGPTSWQNVKLDVKISDSLNTDTQHNKMVSLICLDGNSSQVRSQSGDGLINIDARPSIRPDGRIYLQLMLEYRPELPAQAEAAAAPRNAAFSESLNLLVTDAKPIVASQSADPRSDRKVTIEVTATVLK